MVPDGWDLEYLYVGTDDVQATLSTYLDEPGARKLWHFRGDGAEIAAVATGHGPKHVVAQDRPDGTCLPLFSVPHLDATAAELAEHGWHAQGDPFEMPLGPCRLVEDPTGNTFGIFENVHPYAMWTAYSDPSNPRAVHE